MVRMSIRKETISHAMRVCHRRHEFIIVWDHFLVGAIPTLVIPNKKRPQLRHDLGILGREHLEPVLQAGRSDWNAIHLETPRQSRETGN